LRNGNKNTKADVINSPSHYTQGSMEVIEAIEGLDLDYHEGTVLKYIARWRHKNGIEDLHKAKWFLNRLIEKETQNADA
jgi:hypothetical protein